MSLGSVRSVSCAPAIAVTRATVTSAAPNGASADRQAPRVHTLPFRSQTVARHAVIRRRRARPPGAGQAASRRARELEARVRGRRTSTRRSRRRRAPRSGRAPPARRSTLDRSSHRRRGRRRAGRGAPGRRRRPRPRRARRRPRLADARERERRDEGFGPRHGPRGDARHARRERVAERARRHRLHPASLSIEDHANDTARMAAAAAAQPSLGTPRRGGGGGRHPREGEPFSPLRSRSDIELRRSTSRRPSSGSRDASADERGQPSREPERRHHERPQERSAGRRRADRDHHERPVAEEREEADAETGAVEERGERPAEVRSPPVRAPVAAAAAPGRGSR